MTGIIRVIVDVVRTTRVVMAALGARRVSMHVTRSLRFLGLQALFAALTFLKPRVASWRYQRGQT